MEGCGDAECPTGCTPREWCTSYQRSVIQIKPVDFRGTTDPAPRDCRLRYVEVVHCMSFLSGGASRLCFVRSAVNVSRGEEFDEQTNIEDP